MIFYTVENPFPTLQNLMQAIYRVWPDWPKGLSGYEARMELSKRLGRDCPDDEPEVFAKKWLPMVLELERKT